MKHFPLTDPQVKAVFTCIGIAYMYKNPRGPTFKIKSQWLWIVHYRLPEQTQPGYSHGHCAIFRRHCAVNQLLQARVTAAEIPAMCTGLPDELFTNDELISEVNNRMSIVFLTSFLIYFCCFWNSFTSCTSCSMTAFLQGFQFSFFQGGAFTPA